jgi:hypothetical protein
VESLLRRHVRTKLGSRRINDVKRSEITKLLDDIAAQPSTHSSAMLQLLLINMLWGRWLRPKQG